MLSREPAVIAGALSEIVRAIIPTLIIFGFIQWTDDQVAQVMLLISVIVGVVGTILTRQSVVPTGTANAQILTATRMPEGTTVADVIKEEESQR